MVEAGKKKMKAVVIRDRNGTIDFTQDEVDIPTPGPGQVLIKVEAAPLNPSDLYHMEGQYNGDYEFPLVVGSEGSGTVLQSGGGLIAWTMVGKRVAFTRQAEGGGKYTAKGTYAEYCVTSAIQCLVLDDKISFEQGCNGNVNPITAIGLRDRVITYKSPAVVIDAANSQISKMMFRAFKEKKIEVVAIVRKEDQVESLKQNHGLRYVLNQTSESFAEDLKSAVKETKAKVAIDAIAGDMPGKLLDSMGRGAICIVFGLLSQQPLGGVNTLKLIGLDQRIEGFFLPVWLKEKNPIAALSAINQAKELIDTTTISKVIPLSQIKQGIEEYKQNMSAGKIILNPNLPDA